MDLAKAKKAFKKIIKDRHDRLGTSATADLHRIDVAPSPMLAWQEARAILAKLAPAEALGCCTYTIDGEPQPFKVKMTQTECAGIPGNFDIDPNTCPPD